MKSSGLREVLPLMIASVCAFVSHELFFVSPHLLYSLYLLLVTILLTSIFTRPKKSLVFAGCAVPFLTLVVVLLGATNMEYSLAVGVTLTALALPHYPGHLGGMGLIAMGAWISSIPMFLDWNQPWHTFPNPVMVGATATYLISLPITDNHWKRIDKKLIEHHVGSGELEVAVTLYCEDMADERRENLRSFIQNLEGTELVGAGTASTPAPDPSPVSRPMPVPPINPQMIPQTKANIEVISRDLNGVLSWLEKEMSSISKKTLDFVDAHADAVDNVCDSSDELIKATYSLMSKAGVLQKDLVKIEMMSSHLKSIKKYLERLDNALLKPPNK